MGSVSAVGSVNTQLAPDGVGEDGTVESAAIGANTRERGATDG
ncbi:hypothetical protein Rrhod_2822 [Rhodococcus rhodnii LMG 5362]|uniref:Uncharacterized protein n=1 Tax=Rhodococcus rhodnii LMG 5362 TaxID=1273125 RepID=R7WKV4_9NOCA|nr:hypothetical protein Rrhod_2822 [Rhodococcus rhodnii LMG 5362]